jgi:PII-like signaling protein
MRELLRISIYINEADEWRRRPLHLEVLRMLHDRGIAGGTVLRAVAGFTANGKVETTSLVDAGGRLPLVIEFIDSPEKVEAVLDELRTMTGNRLIVRERVQAIDGA